jgi:hypothetical protein
VAYARRKKLLQHWCIDDADDGDAIDCEADRDAEHGEHVSEVDGAIQRVYDPGRRVAYQVVTG